MEDQNQTSFTFEIDNFSEKEGDIFSPKFKIGGCEWVLLVRPKGDIFEDCMSLYLFVPKSESLRHGWFRRASHSFFLLNQYGEEIYSAHGRCSLFCAQYPGWGWADAVALENLQEKRFLEKNKLIIKMEVKVAEVVDEGLETWNETLDIGGFQVLYTQFVQVSRMFHEHPDLALNFIPKSQLVKTTYMNLLLFLIEKLKMPPCFFTKNELSDARNELIDLTKAGFKLDWLTERLDEISLEWKKENADASSSSSGSRVQELEEQVDYLNFELETEKIKSATSAAYVEEHVQELEEEVEYLNFELETEKVKSINSAAQVISLTHMVSDLRAELLSKEKTKATPNKDVVDSVVRSWEVLDYPDLSNEEVE